MMLVDDLGLNVYSISCRRVWNNSFHMNHNDVLLIVTVQMKTYNTKHRIPSGPGIY